MSFSHNPMGAAARRVEGRKNRAALLALITKRPRTTPELVAASFLARQTVTSHLQELEAEGIVRRSRKPNSGNQPPVWSIVEGADDGQ